MSQRLTLSQVAELIPVPQGTLRYWRHTGQGPRSFKIGRRVLYDADDVESWIEAARQAEAGQVRAS
ncbi:MAG: helix-turn-helix transcriptional regulator [Candidatus Nanopelagicales bacterium]